MAEEIEGEEDEVGTQPYVPKEAKNDCLLQQDINIGGQDYKSGDSVALTDEEVKTLKDLGVKFSIAV